MTKILMHGHISVFLLPHRAFVLLEYLNHFESSFLFYTMLLRLSTGVSLTQKHPEGSDTDRNQIWVVEGLLLQCPAAVTSGWGDSKEQPGGKEEAAIWC